MTKPREERSKKYDQQVLTEKDGEAKFLWDMTIIIVETDHGVAGLIPGTFANFKGD